MKEGLEKHFEENAVPPEQMPEVTQEAQQELPFEEPIPTVEKVEKEEAAPVEEAAAPQEEVIEIGDVKEEAPALETVEEPQPEKPTFDLPEGVDKLVEFINETGGTLQDYVGLNKDYDSLDQANLLKEYYKQTKPHLDADDIDYLINKRLDIDEDLEENEHTRKEDRVKRGFEQGKIPLGKQQREVLQRIES